MPASRGLDVGVAERDGVLDDPRRIVLGRGGNVEAAAVRVQPVERVELVLRHVTAGATSLLGRADLQPINKPRIIVSTEGRERVAVGGIDLG